ncbi:MAG: hypothetical protein WDO71_25950 [Bacteroidota bacterium]
MPLKAERPVEIPNAPVFERFAPAVRVPILKLGFVEFPMVLPDILNVPAPVVLMPFIPPQVEAVVPIAFKAPIVLF